MLLGLQTVPIRIVRHEKRMRSEMRLRLNPQKVQQYAKEKSQGSHFPAPVVFVDPDGLYWTGDGFHRIEADFANNETKVQVYLKAGTLKDAILWNLRANRETHGLPFGPGDITKAVKCLLTDKTFARYTRKQISEVVGCSYSMVSVVARKIGLPCINKGRGRSCPVGDIVRLLAQGKTKQQIADELGVGLRTVYREDVRSQFVPCPHCHGSGRILKQ